MPPNPFLGVVLHAIGGLAAATCFIPFKGIRRWSWETYWLVNAFVGWVITAWGIACLTSPNVLHILSSAPRSSVLLTYFFGAMWGVGGLCFGLTIRYLGWSLGYALSLGFTAAFGTLVPPISHGQFSSIIGSASGLTTLGGIVICLAGIAVCGKAGLFKERELTASEKKATITEFDLAKGVWIALIAGVMSGCFALALDSGKPIGNTAVAMGTAPWWKNSAVLVPLLAGGFTVNLVCCMYLSIHNGTTGDYLGAKGVPRAMNGLFAALAGLVWYEQFMFYGMGTTRMGRYDFCSFSIHIAFIIIFSNVCGLLFREWRGTSRRTHGLLFGGLLVLMTSTVVMGLGNYIATLQR